MLERVPGMNPGSYLTLRPGTDVVTADGQRIGSVKHVLVDEATNIFDGIVIDTGAGGLHFVDAPEVSEIREDAVLIAILLPTLSKAREQARRVSCLSNVRQLTAAVLLYMGENKQFLPEACSTNSPVETPIRPFTPRSANASRISAAARSPRMASSS